MKGSKEVKRLVAKIRRKYGAKNGVICAALMFWPHYKNATDKSAKRKEPTP